MKIAIVSDLHWESEQISPLDTTDFDVLVVAGDALGGHDQRDPIEVLGQWVSDKPIVFVPGNHEFECRDIRSAVARLKSSAACNFPIFVFCTTMCWKWKVCAFWAAPCGRIFV